MAELRSPSLIQHWREIEAVGPARLRRQRGVLGGGQLRYQLTAQPSPHPAALGFECLDLRRRHHARGPQHRCPQMGFLDAIEPNAPRNLTASSSRRLADALCSPPPCSTPRKTRSQGRQQGRRHAGPRTQVAAAERRHSCSRVYCACLELCQHASVESHLYQGSNC